MNDFKKLQLPFTYLYMDNASYSDKQTFFAKEILTSFQKICLSTKKPKQNPKQTNKILPSPQNPSKQKIDPNTRFFLKQRGAMLLALNHRTSGVVQDSFLKNTAPVQGSREAHE